MYNVHAKFLIVSNERMTVELIEQVIDCSQILENELSLQIG